MGRFWSIISQNYSISKSNWLQVVNFRTLFIIDLTYIPQILKNDGWYFSWSLERQSIIFSTSTNSSVTGGQLSDDDYEEEDILNWWRRCRLLEGSIFGDGRLQYCSGLSCSINGFQDINKALCDIWVQQLCADFRRTSHATKRENGLHTIQYCAQV